MSVKRKFNLAILLVIALLILLFIFLQQARNSYTEKKTPSQLLQECLPHQRTECTTEGYKGFKVCEDGKFSKCFIANLDECHINPSQLYSVCCKSKDGILSSCNDKKEFTAGEYVIIKTNLQMALNKSGVKLDSYKACGFSNLVQVNSKIAEHYQKDTSFNDQKANIGCSNTFYQKDFHQGAAAGFIPQSKGKTRLVEWRAYPKEATVSSPSEALSQLSSSYSVFTFEVNVVE